ncbi:MAG: membrane integrity-associated transporter subunit PqiC [Acidobacteria bacterium]|nr:membrane integrity-associated transporter subunit PqiC [Acidobacteriota bacterium]
MNQRITAVLISLVMSLLLAGCLGGKTKYPAYYTLQVPPPPDPPRTEAARPKLAVRQFTSPGYLRQGAIVYRVSAEQIGFYDYHRWAVDPREFVTNAIIDHLRAGNSFDDVKPYDGRTDVDYILSGRLEKLEELDYGGGVRVEVAMSAHITSLKTGGTVWTNAVDVTEHVEGHNVAGVVSAMNAAMERSIEKLVSSQQIAQVAH